MKGLINLEVDKTLTLEMERKLKLSPGFPWNNSGETEVHNLIRESEKWVAFLSPAEIFSHR
jgi:hypothetical protein